MSIKESDFPRITEEELNNLRSRIGVKISRDPEPWCYEATRDNIRHYAHGIVMIILFGANLIMQHRQNITLLLPYHPFFSQLAELPQDM